MTAKQRAHDLAIAFINYKFHLENKNTDAEHEEDIFFENYKEAYNNFLDMINEGV